MPSIRPATHSHSWYTGHGNQLNRQLAKYFDNNFKDKSRIVIGPHAGYTYSGERLGEAFNSLNLQGIKRVFILGPSHHVYFRDYAYISKYDYYETPIGDLKVDRELGEELTKHKEMRFMKEQIDQDEHSFEMHCPFLKYKMNQEGIDTSDLQIVPVMISHLDTSLLSAVSNILLPYFKDESNAFVISSDFCHWGSRFGYTEYLSKPIAYDDKHILFKQIESSIISLDNHDTRATKIYQSIEQLDKFAMNVMSVGDYSDWINYIKLTGNTICGQKPILIILKLLALTNDSRKFKWCGYSQSSQVHNINESSVSYASGYV